MYSKKKNTKVTRSKLGGRGRGMFREKERGGAEAGGGGRIRQHYKNPNLKVWVVVVK